MFFFPFCRRANRSALFGGGLWLHHATQGQPGGPHAAPPSVGHAKARRLCPTTVPKNTPLFTIHPTSYYIYNYNSNFTVSRMTGEKCVRFFNSHVLTSSCSACCKEELESQRMWKFSRNHIGKWHPFPTSCLMLHASGWTFMRDLLLFLPVFFLFFFQVFLLPKALIKPW